MKTPSIWKSIVAAWPPAGWPRAPAVRFNRRATETPSPSGRRRRTSRASLLSKAFPARATSARILLSGIGMANWITGDNGESLRLQKPFGVALDENGNLCLTDTDANRLLLPISRNKQWRRYDGAGKTKFVSPVAVARRNGIFYVADSELGESARLPRRRQICLSRSARRCNARSGWPLPATRCMSWIRRRTRFLFSAWTENSSSSSANAAPGRANSIFPPAPPPTAADICSSPTP